MDDAAREPGRDDADELRALYARLEAPPLPDGIEEADPETQRVTRWMQAAWRRVEPPRVLRPPLSSRRPIRGRRVRWIVLAAAAAVLLAAGGLFLVSRPAPAMHPPPSETAAAPDASAGIEILAVDPERIELRSGPVRLVLLDALALPDSDSAGT